MTAPHRLMAAVAHQMPAGSDFRIRETVQGRLSGRERVLPVALYIKLGSATPMLVFSDDMEPVGFAALLQDVGAGGGALVRPEGWSDDEAALARDWGFTLHASYSEALLNIPALYRCLYIKEVSPSLCGSGMYPLPADLSPPDIELFDSDWKPLGTVRKLLWKRWASGGLAGSPGSHTRLEIVAGDTFTRVEFRFYPLKIRLDLTVTEALYLAHLPPTGAAEFLNSDAPADVETVWTSLPSTAALAVQPLTRTAHRLKMSG